MKEKIDFFKGIKKNDIDSTMLVNTWLKMFHGVTMSEIEGNYKKDKDGNYLAQESTRFYNDYKITQEQHDFWDKEMRKQLRKKLGMSKKLFDRSYAFTYLNIAPSVIRED